VWFPASVILRRSRICKVAVIVDGEAGVGPGHQ
jgi:hypothetical protein